MGKCIYLIVGRSGSGKTTIVEALEKRYGLKSVQSYTTRPKRTPDETGHIFVPIEEYDDSPAAVEQRVAYTVYDDNYYWATQDQIEENDLFVVDPAGIHYFLAKYKGKKKVKIIVISVCKSVAYDRMLGRGDFKNASRVRSEMDARIFRNLRGDFKADNNEEGQEAFDDCVESIWDFICEQEQKYA